MTVAVDQLAKAVDKLSYMSVGCTLVPPIGEPGCPPIDEAEDPSGAAARAGILVPLGLESSMRLMMVIREVNRVSNMDFELPMQSSMLRVMKAHHRGRKKAPA